MNDTKGPGVKNGDGITRKRPKKECKFRVFPGALMGIGASSRIARVTVEYHSSMTSPPVHENRPANRERTGRRPRGQRVTRVLVLLLLAFAATATLPADQTTELGLRYFPQADRVGEFER